MQFEPTDLEGAWLIRPDRIEDERGFFARAWCEQEFQMQGLNSRLLQCNISHNHVAGTLRGLHWQAEPHREVKLVRCTSGAIFDVIVDVRPDSSTFARWQGFELTKTNRHMLYIPEGFAHGFITLTDDSEIFYQMSELYVASESRGMHWADDSLQIEWPRSVQVISDRDDQLPGLAEAISPNAIDRKVA